MVYENGRETLFMPATQPFSTVLLESFGSHITGDALAWLHRQKVCLIVSCDGEPVAIPAAAPMAKVELRRKQYAALDNPLPLAQRVIVQKIESGRVNGRFTAEEARAFKASVLAAQDIQGVHLAEARAATIYFEYFNAALSFRKKKKGESWPVEWEKWPGRLSPIAGSGPKHATHPINAMMNCAYTVAAAQLTRALASAGLDPACGFLHQPSDSRASLAYDALELLRADIDTRMLSLIEVRRWARADFPVTAEGVVRLSRACAHREQPGAGDEAGC